MDCHFVQECSLIFVEFDWEFWGSKAYVENPKN